MYILHIKECLVNEYSAHSLMIHSIKMQLFRRWFNSMTYIQNSLQLSRKNSILYTPANQIKKLEAWSPGNVSGTSRELCSLKAFSLPGRGYTKPFMTLLILALINFTIIFLALPFPVSAALGGDTASIKADLSRMKGAINIIQAGAYSVHEITLSTGTVVREYVSSTGIVFGVAWQGHFMPNLEQILGAYFNQYSAASKTEHVKHLGRRPLNIQRTGLVVQTGGHMRAYVGRVYIPSRIPQGVTADIIR